MAKNNVNNEGTPSTTQCSYCGMIKINDEMAKRIADEADKVRKQDILNFMLSQTDIPKKYRDIINKNFWELL